MGASSCTEAEGYVVVSLASGWRLVTPEERAELGVLAAVVIGHYLGESVGDLANDTIVDPISEG